MVCVTLKVTKYSGIKTILSNLFFKLRNLSLPGASRSDI